MILSNLLQSILEWHFDILRRVGLLLVVSIQFCEATDHDVFIFPGNGLANDEPRWGVKDGIQIGLHPLDGPRGLIRIYAPFLEIVPPKMVNFLSIEPSVVGERGRGQSELEASRIDVNETGLAFRASNDLEIDWNDLSLARGEISADGEWLRIFVHSEPFLNGAIPIVEVRFWTRKPREIELILHQGARSAPIDSFTISATMGNFGLLRRLHLKDPIVDSNSLWSDLSFDRLDFLPWQRWSAESLKRLPEGRVYVVASPDIDSMEGVFYDSRVAPFWHYQGKLARHYWIAEDSEDLLVAVNGRTTYWMSQAPIPGGIAFENFELRRPFQPQSKLWFGISPLAAD